MAGFPDYVLDKFLNYVVEEDYTVAIYDQVKEGKNHYQRTFASLFKRNSNK